MKKLKFFGKVLAALVLAGGMLFSATSCSETAEDVVNAITGNSTVDNLLGNFKTGTYMGKVKKVKLAKGVNGKLTVTWENPTDDSRFKSVNIYLNEEPRPAFQWQEGDECKAILEGLEEGKRYTVSVFALGLEDNGQESHSLNPWYGTVRLGESDVTKYQYIGRGYDAINGEYFSEKGIKNAILEFDDNYIPSNEKNNSSDIKYSAGTTIVSYKKSFNQSVGVEAEFGGFGGGVDVGFSKESSSSSENGFASAYGNYMKWHEWLTPGQSKLAVLKEHLSLDFANDINDESVTPEELFRDYGTHVLIDTSVGGRFVMNFEVKKTDETTAESIKVAVKASYSGVSGSSSTGNSSENSSSNEKMTITGYSRGGSSISFSSVEDATESWAEWTAYLNENDDSWSLVEAKDTIVNENKNTGIWLFANEENRRNAIKAYYDEKCAANKNALANALVTGTLSVGFHSLEATYTRDEGTAGQYGVEPFWTIKVGDQTVESFGRDGNKEMDQRDGKSKWYGFVSKTTSSSKPSESDENCVWKKFTVSKRNSRDIIIHWDLYEKDTSKAGDDTCGNIDIILKYNAAGDYWYLDLNGNHNADTAVNAAHIEFNNDSKMLIGRIQSRDIDMNLRFKVKWSD